MPITNVKKKRSKHIRKSTEKAKELRDELRYLQTLAWQKYGNRCKAMLKCDGIRATAIHEIVPRSMGRRAYTVENMLPVCEACHTAIHNMGAMKFAHGYLDSRKSLPIPSL